MPEADHPVVMVDDNAAEIEMARMCYEMAALEPEWRSFQDPLGFLEFLAGVKDGREPMPHVVLLDINMPALNGFDVLAETRKDPFFAELPIFMMLTNSDNPADKSKATALGASGYHTKPDNVKAYVELLRSVVGSPAEL